MWVESSVNVCKKMQKRFSLKKKKNKCNIDINISPLFTVGDVPPDESALVLMLALLVLSVLIEDLISRKFFANTKPQGEGK